MARFLLLNSGRKNKACLSFNHEVSPTIEQMFEMFFQRVYCWNDCTCNMLTSAGRQAMPHDLWGVPALDGPMVPDGNHQWPRAL